jgi:NADH dehydrogenase [ubiquinone] 1 alpha subcomplex assembly factor 1
MSTEHSCRLLHGFDQDSDLLGWQVVNDNVMGGRSSGDAILSDGKLVFTGNINTRGGGFSSIRAPLSKGALQDMNLVKLRVLPDARGYQLIAHTDATYDGRPVAYRASIGGLNPGQWCQASVLFSELQPTVFGRPLPGPVFDPSRARLLGIILADGQDGPFRLEIAEISACK